MSNIDSHEARGNLQIQSSSLLGTRLASNVINMKAYVLQYDMISDQW